MYNHIAHRISGGTEVIVWYEDSDGERQGAHAFLDGKPSRARLNVTFAELERKCDEIRMKAAGLTML